MLGARRSGPDKRKVDLRARRAGGAIEIPLPAADFSAAYTRLVRRKGTDLASITHGCLGRWRRRHPGGLRQRRAARVPDALTTAACWPTPRPTPAQRAASPRRAAEPGDAHRRARSAPAPTTDSRCCRCWPCEPSARPSNADHGVPPDGRTTHHRSHRQRSRARARRGRPPHAARGPARRDRPDRYQGVLRGRRVRGLYRARGRPLGQLLPDAGRGGRRQQAC